MATKSGGSGGHHGDRGDGGNVQTTNQDLDSQRAKNHTQFSQQSIQHSLSAIPQLLLLAEDQLIDIKRNLCTIAK
jgi:hypothetical protein